ncbi:MAG: glycosyltransferase [Lachnospiraceae bacterium]|nr:glycosyltransferase [Lachnospiraceae bacterium]
MISIIVPIYNVGNYLKKCIDSILEQTYENIEVILVDDGSTDDSSFLCDLYSEKDNRVIVIHKENGGLDSARKAGVKSATGDYIGYVDGDDWVEPDMYEKMVHVIEKSQEKINCVVCGIVENYEERERYRRPYLEEGIYNKRKFSEKLRDKILYTGEFYRSSVSTSLGDKIFSSEIIKKYQLRDGLNTTLSDDSFVSIPALIDGGNLAVIQDCLYHYRIRHDSLKHSLKETNFRETITEFLPVWEETFKMAAKDYDYSQHIKIYLLYTLAMKEPQYFDYNQETLLNLYGGVEYGSKVIVYGAGQTGIVLMKYLKSLELIRVVGWVDRDYDKLDNNELQSPEELKNMEYDYLLVAIIRRDAFESAKKDLIAYGIQDEKIRCVSDNIIENVDKYIY